MLSLRSGFAWTFAGNALYAASQWAVLSMLAKLGGRETLGQYALAVALTAPVAMLAHLNLRAVLATDVQGWHALGDYLAVRFRVSALGLVAMALLALGFGQDWAASGVILLVGLGVTSETLSDAYYGAMQRRGEMDRIARSMIARGVLSAAAFAVVLWISGSLVWAVAALVAGRIALLAGYDRPRGLGGAVDRLKPVPPDRLKPVPPDRLEPVPPGAWGILRQALPLGAVLMLVSLNTNLPRYAIERSLGLAELGAFAAVASFVTAGATVVNALGQAATPRLAQQASSGESGAFLRLAVKLCALAAGLGLAGVLASAALGGPLLALVYRPEYAGYQGLLLGMAGAAIPAYAAAALGYAVTAARAFDAQVPLFCIVAMSCGAASWLLIPRFGLAGAALALACAALVQIAGQAMILRRALRRGEEAL